MLQEIPIGRGDPRIRQGLVRTIQGLVLVAKGLDAGGGDSHRTWGMVHGLQNEGSKSGLLGPEDILKSNFPEEDK